MIRNVSGAVLALIAAAVAIASTFGNWYDGRAGHDIRLRELFSGSGLTSAEAGLFTGLFLPMLAVAVLTVLGVVFRMRLLVALAGLAALAFTILWMVRQYQIADSLVIGSNGMSIGSLSALGSGVLLLIASTLMAGRHRTARLAEPAPRRETEPAPGGASRRDPGVAGPRAGRPGRRRAAPERHRPAAA